MRIGIFGGTFDPPHLGHLILAAEAVDQLELERLLFVLTPDPPHKQGQQITELRHRLGMLRAAIAGNEAFVLSKVDIDRPPPHYAVDTVNLLAAAYPGAELVYLMGGDSLSDLPTWHAPRDFLAACSLIGVMRRPGDGVDLAALERELPGIAAKASFFEAPLLQIASSDLRCRVAEGRPYRYYLPVAVYQYIRRRQLYQPGEI